MRLLHVINALGGSGGAENRLVEEVVHFDPSHNQMVVRLYERRFLQDRLENVGIPVVSLNLRSDWGAWNWPLGAWRLRRLVKSFRPDLIQTSLFAANLVGQLAGLVSNVPVVSTMTLTGDPELHRRYQPGASSWQAAMLRRVAAFVARRPGVWYRAITDDAMVTNCQSMRFPVERVRVITRGVDVTRAAAAADRARFGLPQNVPLFVSVGRQTAQKAQVLLVRAMSAILTRVPSAHLAIAGEESDASSSITAEINSQHLESRVHLLGFRPDAHILMASADVFMFSSLAEGLGTVVVEAMLAGLPVVAFDIPPVREVVGDQPFCELVAPGDVSLLAEAAVRMLKHPNRRGLSEAARQWAVAKYDLRVIAAQVEGYLVEVASRGGPSR